MKTLQVPRWMRNLMMGIIALIWLSPNEAQAAKVGGVSFQVFYDELMPYGDWVKDGRHGYVWLPAVYEDFHPYGTNGHWVMTNYGNTWVSDYDWGWATFHYGRWYFDDNYQSWAWIPDYDWGPAWVDWRSGGGYYGWAPMGPGFSVNLRINIPATYWLFVPQRRFGYANVYNYYVPYGRRVNIYNNTTIINNTVVYNNNHYYGGPSQREVERVTNRSYPERRIVNSNSAGRTVASRSSVSAYRPDLQSARGTTAAARPSRTLSSGEARTQPATSPSSQTSRSEAVSGRSASTSAGTSRSPERTGTSPSRSESSGVRSTSPSTSRGEFETTPYSGSQTRTSTPTRESQGTYTNSRSSESRTSSPTVRTESYRQPETRSTQTRTQSSTPTQRTAPARTQTAPAQRSTESRTAPSGSSRTQPATSRTQSSSPATRSIPASSSQTRSTPTTSRSTPQVGSSSGSRTAPASTSRTSSGTSRTSSSSSRGNN